MLSPAVAATLTLALPPGILAVAVVAFFVVGPLGMLAVPLAPLGLGAGYWLAGLAGRGGLVVLGGYVVLALGVALLYATPTDFEDAGVLVTLVAAVAGLAFLAYAGWAAWDVYHQLSVPAPR